MDRVISFVYHRNSRASKEHKQETIRVKANRERNRHYKDRSQNKTRAAKINQQAKGQGP